MKVILTADVPNLGRPTEIIAVKNGYARNYLLPNGLAMPYSSSLAAEIEKMNAEREKQREEVLANAAHYGAEIAKITLKFTAKASDKKVLYGSITSTMITGQLAADHKISLNPEDIIIPDNHIKETGTHKVIVKLGSEEAELKVKVTAEK